MSLNTPGAAAWHPWFAWHSVLCADINGVRTASKFFMRKWLTNVYRRSAPTPGGRQWVYCFEDPYDGYDTRTNDERAVADKEVAIDAAHTVHSRPYKFELGPRE